MESRYKCPSCGKSVKIRGKRNHKKFICRECGIYLRGPSVRKLISQIHEVYDPVRVELMKDTLMYAALKAIGNKKEYKIAYDENASSFWGEYILRAHSSKFVLCYSLVIRENKTAILMGVKKHDVSEDLSGLLGIVFRWNGCEN